MKRRWVLLIIVAVVVLLLAAVIVLPNFMSLGGGSRVITMVEAESSMTEAPRYAPADEAAEPPAPPPAPVPAVVGRKLIREGDIGMHVRDAEQARGKLERLAEDAGGFVSNVRVQVFSDSRSIEIDVRVPVEAFDSFVEQVRDLGEVSSESLHVIDVTDQYVDLERRIATNEMLADRLEQLIREKSYQFRDLLEVERELARLHLEREQLLGSQRGLDDRIALSTLSVMFYQSVEQRVVPPDSVFAPLVNAIENAGPRFKASINALMAVLGGLITITIYIAPWLVVLAVLGLVVWALIKVLIRRGKRIQK